MSAQGLLMCSRYAYSPNKLEFCGPLRSRDVSAYLHEGVADPGLRAIMSEFETVLPYLTIIAHENGISDVFDRRVVEAYFIGNSLLDAVSMNSLREHFSESLKLKKRLSPFEFSYLLKKIPQGARAHHTFHVLNIFTRTGHHSVRHTLDTMNSCRISWGTLVFLDGDTATLSSPSLILNKGMLELSPEINIKVSIPSWLSVSERNIGHIFTYHWGTLCERISKGQKERLHMYTQQAIILANRTL